MIRLSTARALALAAVAVAVPARESRAQDTGLLPIRAKIGVFLPQGNTKDFAGSTNFIVEGDLALPRLLGGKYFLSAGYTQGSNNGAKLRTIPVTIGRYFAPPNPVAGLTGNVYGGVGLGPYFVRAFNNTADAGGDGSKVVLGGFASVGYQFPAKYFVEAKYHVTAQRVAGARFGGLAVMVGTRF